MTFQTVDDILAYYGGDREVEEDDTKGQDVLSGGSEGESEQ